MKTEKKTILISIIVSLILTSITLLTVRLITVKKSLKSSVIMSYEIGYFQGQRDYRNNIIKIKVNPDSSLSWEKPPIDNRQPVFSPNTINNKLTVNEELNLPLLK